MRWSVATSPSVAGRRARPVSRALRRAHHFRGRPLLACDRHRERERNREDCLERLRNAGGGHRSAPASTQDARAASGAERRLRDKRMRAVRKQHRHTRIDVEPLKTGSFGPVAERGEMSIVRASDATIIVRLAGTWELATGLPSPDPVRQELARGRARAVAFDTRELRAWDSAVVTFLARVTEVCRERGIPLDRRVCPRACSASSDSPRPFRRGPACAAAPTGVAGSNGSAPPRSPARRRAARLSPSSAR